MSTYKKIMTDKELQEKVLKLVNDYKTCYLFGGIGQVITGDVINQKAKQLPLWYTNARIRNLNSYIGKNTYGFDCVNTIKAILWGWENGKLGKYQSNTIPDINADKMITLCEDVSTDMKNIKPMELIYFKGHVGLYLGKINGVDYCVECAPSTDKVSVTKMSYQNKWIRHGKLPWITYTEELKKDDKLDKLEVPKKAVTNKSTKDEVKWIQTQLNRFISDKLLFDSNKKVISTLLAVDGLWGGKTATALLAFIRYKKWDDSKSEGYYAGIGTINALKL